MVQKKRKRQNANAELRLVCDSESGIFLIVVSIPSVFRHVVGRFRALVADACFMFSLCSLLYDGNLVNRLAASHKTPNEIAC